MRTLQLLAAGAALSVLLLAGCESKQEKHEEGVVEAYAKQLKSADAKARAEAAERLGTMTFSSSDARDDAVDALGGSLGDAEGAVRKAAAKSLRKIGSVEALKTLRDAAAKTGQAGAKEAQDEYEDALRDLKSAARQGKPDAQDKLKALGVAWDTPEPPEKTEVDVPGVKIEVQH
jgi:HEAT repeat protein